MASIEEQIESVEKEIRETPYHKGTEHHIGKLRARLSKLRENLLESSTRRGGGGGLRLGGASGSERGYAVKKQGDATVILIGPPSAGKSTLINKLTKTQSKVAAYAFTTVTVIPGMMEYKNAKIQILDVPGLIEGAEEGKGRGREVLSVARSADLIILMTDITRPEALDRIEKALVRNGIRPNIVRPNVIIDKKVSGGIIIHSSIKQDLSKDTIKEVAQELGIKNAEITINEKLTMEKLIDAFSPNRVYLPAIFIINKVDELKEEQKVKGGNQVHPALPAGRPSGARDYDDSNYRSDAVYISAEKGRALQELKAKIWETLGFVNVYLVRPDEEPGHNNPIVAKKNQTLYDVTEKLGSEFLEGKSRAKIWGAGAKFPGQEVSLSTVVQEGMQVRFI